MLSFRLLKAGLTPNGWLAPGAAGCACLFCSKRFNGCLGFLPRPFGRFPGLPESFACLLLFGLQHFEMLASRIGEFLGCLSLRHERVHVSVAVGVTIHFTSLHRVLCLGEPPGLGLAPVISTPAKGAGDKQKLLTSYSPAYSLYQTTLRLSPVEAGSV